MSLLDTLDPVLRPWAQQLYDLAKSAGDNPRVTSARRTYAQQQALYQAYIQGRSKYPAAAPGSSAHEYGLAFDMVVDGPGEQAGAGGVWQSWGGRYGGEEDPIHFEYPGFSPTVGTSPSAPTTVTSPSIRSKAEQLADQLIWFLPLPLRGILSTGVIATAILSIFGNDAAAVISWGLTHPAELADDLVDVLWGIARASLGL